MVLPLLVSLALPVQASGPPPAGARSHNPPVTVRLSDTSYARGTPARVYVRLGDTSHLVVLRASGDGHIRVLFPLSPADEDVVPGGRTYELPGPDDREAFTVDEPDGTGTILAARSAAPFRFDPLAPDDAWDYAGALLFQQTSGDPLAALLDIVERMAGQHRVDLDVATYAVAPALAAEPAAPEPSCVFCTPTGGGGAGGPLYGAQGEPYSEPAEPPAPGAILNTDCSGAYVAEGAFCGSLVYSPMSYSTTTNSFPYPYYDPFLNDPFLFLPVIVVRQPAPAPPPAPMRAVAIAVRLRRPQGTVRPPAQPRYRPAPVIRSFGPWWPAGTGRAPTPPPTAVSETRARLPAGVALVVPHGTRPARMPAHGAGSVGAPPPAAAAARVGTAQVAPRVLARRPR